MSIFKSNAVRRKHVTRKHVTRKHVTRKHVLAGCALAFLAYGACTLGPAIGADQATIPNFAPDSNVGWVASGKGFGVDFVQPPSGPGPVTNDPAYPYLTNAEAARTGRRPTYRVADLSNPILKPWAVEQMRKANEEVIAGKIPFTADSRCYPAGVPSFLLFPANPVRFIQTPTQVLMIWQQDATDPARLFEPAAFGQSDAVLVRRIRRPLRGRRYPRRRYHRAERQDLRRQLPDAAHHRAARDRTIQADRRRTDHRSRTCTSKIPAPSPRRGTQSNVTGASRTAR